MNNYWYCKVIIGLFAFIGMFNNAFGMSPEDLFPTVAFIQGQKTKKIEIDNIAHELWVKKQGEEIPRPYKESISGTGFFLSEGSNVYLVTAEHIAKKLGIVTAPFLTSLKAEIIFEDSTELNNASILVTDVDTFQKIIKEEYGQWNRETLLTEQKLSLPSGQLCVRELHPYAPAILSYSFPLEEKRDVLGTSWL